MGHIQSTEEAAVAGAGTLNAADGQLFTFTAPMRKVIISNNSGYDLLVHLGGLVCNDADSEATAVVKANGGVLTYTDEKDTVSQVACYCTQDIDYGKGLTGFLIKGRPWWE